MSSLQMECEKFFRTLSKQIPTDWKKIATRCEISSSKIDSINLDNLQVEEKSFKFLVHLRNKSPKLLDWSKVLGKALCDEDRNDLVGQLDNFIQKVKQDAMDEDSSESQSSSTSRTPKKGSPRVTPRQNLIKRNTKAEGRTAKKRPNISTSSEEAKLKCKRRLPNDDKENLAGTACSSPRKTEKVKKEKPTFLPVQPPPGKLKQVNEISKEEPLRSDYTKVWNDHMLDPTGTNKPQKGDDNYYFHCFVRDDSGVSIYTSCFCKYQKDCSQIYRKVKASTQEKPIYLSRFRVEYQTPDYLGKPGRSNFRLIINEWSVVKKAYQMSK
ncbi:uncharacterized protein [Asterias amurensis]|uniref:uncharacterized protein isoform X2 n=1 Tax=Asterias amurensis TaxID=7602 RepID=UPI003AB69282